MSPETVKRWREVRTSITISSYYYFRGSVDFTVCRRRQHAITACRRTVASGRHIFITKIILTIIPGEYSRLYGCDKHSVSPRALPPRLSYRIHFYFVFIFDELTSSFFFCKNLRYSFDVSKQ